MATYLPPRYFGGSIFKGYSSDAIVVTPPSSNTQVGGTQIPLMEGINLSTPAAPYYRVADLVGIQLHGRLAHDFEPADIPEIVQPGAPENIISTTWLALVWQRVSDTTDIFPVPSQNLPPATLEPENTDCYILATQEISLNSGDFTYHTLTEVGVRTGNYTRSAAKAFSWDVPLRPLRVPLVDQQVHTVENPFVLRLHWMTYFSYCQTSTTNLLSSWAIWSENPTGEGGRVTEWDHDDPGTCSRRGIIPIIPGSLFAGRPKK